MQTSVGAQSRCPTVSNTNQAMGILGTAADSVWGRLLAALCRTQGRSSQAGGRSSDPWDTNFLKTSSRIAPESMASGGLHTSGNACQQQSTVTLETSAQALGICRAVSEAQKSKQQTEMASLGVPAAGSRSISYTPTLCVTNILVTIVDKTVSVWSKSQVI